jgi:hypothetical protein
MSARRSRAHERPEHATLMTLANECHRAPGVRLFSANQLFLQSQHQVAIAVRDSESITPWIHVPNPLH